MNINILFLLYTFLSTYNIYVSVYQTYYILPKNVQQIKGGKIKLFFSMKISNKPSGIVLLDVADPCSLFAGLPLICIDGISIFRVAL